MDWGHLLQLCQMMKASPASSTALIFCDGPTQTSSSPLLAPLFYLFFQDLRQTLRMNSSHLEGRLLRWPSQGCTPPPGLAVIDCSRGGRVEKSSLFDDPPLPVTPPTPKPPHSPIPTPAADGYHARLRPTGDICPYQAAVLILNAQISASPPSPCHHSFQPPPPSSRSSTSSLLPQLSWASSEVG